MTDSPRPPTLVPPPAAPPKAERDDTSERIALIYTLREQELATLRLLARLIREAATNRHLHPHGKEALTGVAFTIHSYITDRERESNHE